MKSVRWSSPQDPKSWVPNVKFDESTVITCISNGDAKKAEELFNSLQAENAALRKDAERYRWLRGNYSQIRFTKHMLVPANRHCMDAAIDAAMGEK